MAKIQARARAVDMLGRQQIAGVQNAMVELFKNAHDAYATEVRADYFEDSGENSEGFLIIRDNGIGMTHHDFINKWLVLGTESKISASQPSFRPAGITARPITGEKGIGRLAIALLGAQTLVLTRAIRSDGTHDLVIGLVHWGLFEIPGLNLDEIEVPVETFSGGSLPDINFLAQMRLKLLDCVNKIKLQHPNAAVDSIIAQINSFQPDLQSIYGFLEHSETPHIRLDGDNVGTHFLIAPTNNVIKVELASEEKNDDYSFRKHLLGFSDLVFDENHAPRINTSFRRWRVGDNIGEELLDRSTFFSRHELTELSDHLLDGHVDRFGQFSGTLRVYDKTYDLVIPWGGANGKNSRCGPFSIKFGYLMGRPTESRLSPDVYHPLNAKLDHIGGLYVYRDGVRILPYGDYSFDWLDVEKRRNKGAGYYFFSFRRMFGAVLLTREENIDLQEKAGREGLQQNEAYRHIRDILINLLIQLAAEFFRQKGSNTDAFESAQLEIRKRSVALERQQKQSTTKRRNFAAKLELFSQNIRSNAVAEEIAALAELTHTRMSAASKLTDQDKAAATLLRAEQEAITALAALRQRNNLRRPTGIALGKELQRDWEAYTIERERLESDIFIPFEQNIASTLGAVAEQARIYVDQRKRLEDRLKSLASERRKDLTVAVNQANKTAADTRQSVFNITERARSALDETIRSIQADMNRTDLAGMDPGAVDEMRRRWEGQLIDIEVRHRNALVSARDMLAALAENLQASDGDEPAQIMQAMEERVIALEEQSDEDFEMVQLGLAVAIINHEFAASIKRVRSSIHQLGEISRRSNGIKPLYDSIRSNFEHLDGHLNLFTPLQRRLHRSSIKISGAEIRNYCVDLFSNRLERHNVELLATDTFLSKTVECYPSTLYPAFINVIDNALHWLDSLNGKRNIELAADKDYLYISNNGPSIELTDGNRIFERGFSRKTSGRGLGLFISAKALEAEGIEMSLKAPPCPGYSVTFAIKINNIGETN